VRRNPDRDERMPHHLSLVMRRWRNEKLPANQLGRGGGGMRSYPPTSWEEEVEE
jgi:hypothetical protein